MPRRPVLEFWYEFASTYSYLAAMRIEEMAAIADVEIRWRPFLLGPIFASQGWNTSPFNVYPAKGRHMWRDMEREAARLGLPMRRPDPFPQNTLVAARVAVYAIDHPGLFSRIAGALAVAGASIVDARIHTLTNGMALDTFWVQDAAGGAFDAPHRLARLSVLIEQSLSGRLRLDAEIGKVLTR